MIEFAEKELADNPQTQSLAQKRLLETAPGVLSGVHRAAARRSGRPRPRLAATRDQVEEDPLRPRPVARGRAPLPAQRAGRAGTTWGARAGQREEIVDLLRSQGERRHELVSRFSQIDGGGADEAVSSSGPGKTKAELTAILDKDQVLRLRQVRSADARTAGLCVRADIAATLKLTTAQARERIRGIGNGGFLRQGPFSQGRLAQGRRPKKDRRAQGQEVWPAGKRRAGTLAIEAANERILAVLDAAANGPVESDDRPQPSRGRINFPARPVRSAAGHRPGGRCPDRPSGPGPGPRLKRSRATVVSGCHAHGLCMGHGNCRWFRHAHAKPGHGTRPKEPGFCAAAFFPSLGLLMNYDARPDPSEPRNARALSSSKPGEPTPLPACRRSIAFS